MREEPSYSWRKSGRTYKMNRMFKKLEVEWAEKRDRYISCIKELERGKKDGKRKEKRTC